MYVTAGSIIGQHSIIISGRIPSGPGALPFIKEETAFLMRCLESMMDVS